MGRLFLVGAMFLAFASLGIALWSANRTLPAEGTAPASSPPAAGLEDLRRRMTELEAAAARSAPAGADAAASPSGTENPAGAGALPAPDLLERIGRLEARVKALELRTAAAADWSALTDAEILDRARALASAGKDPATTREAWRTLLDRGPSREVRDEALFGLGAAANSVGRYDEAERAFRELISLAGEGTARAAEARYQIAWVEHRRNHPDLAVREMEAVAASANAPSSLRAHALTNGAYFALRAGDESRARALLDRAIADFADSPVPLERAAVTRALEMRADLDGR